MLLSYLHQGTLNQSDGIPIKCMQFTVDHLGAPEKGYFVNQLTDQQLHDAYNLPCRGHCSHGFNHYNISANVSDKTRPVHHCHA